MSLRVNWFSPLPPTKSGIASDFTAPLVKELASLSDLTLWTSQAGWDQGLECHTPVRYFSSKDYAFAEFEAPAVNIYHLGNNPFHAEIYKLSRRIPGVVVLHETNLLMFFSGLFRDVHGGVAEMTPLFETSEENLGRHLANRYCRGQYETHQLLQLYPLTMAAISGACGVVTHTRSAFTPLAAEGRWPVQYLPLPYPERTPPERRSKINDPLRLIVFGYLGTNRCLDRLLGAIASYHDRDRLHLDVFGEISSDNPAIEVAKNLGINGKNVHFHGFVNDQDLDDALAAADLAVNLRFPTMGESSISQLRIWQSALPCLVTPIGWYGEQPNDTVGWVRPNWERQDLHKHFDAFFAEPEKYHAMGQRGRAHYLKHHQPADYAAAIVKFAGQCASHRKRATADRLLNDLLPSLRALKNQNGLLWEP